MSLRSWSFSPSLPPATLLKEGASSRACRFSKEEVCPFAIILMWRPSHQPKESRNSTTGVAAELAEGRIPKSPCFVKSCRKELLLASLLIILPQWSTNGSLSLPNPCFAEPSGATRCRLATTWSSCPITMKQCQRKRSPWQSTPGAEESKCCCLPMYCLTTSLLSRHTKARGADWTEGEGRSHAAQALLHVKEKSHKPQLHMILHNPWSLHRFHDHI